MDRIALRCFPYSLLTFLSRISRLLTFRLLPLSFRGACALALPLCLTHLTFA